MFEIKLTIFILSFSFSGLLADDLQNDLDLIYERRLQELVTENYDTALANQWYVAIYSCNKKVLKFSDRFIYKTVITVLSSHYITLKTRFVDNFSYVA